MKRILSDYLPSARLTFLMLVAAAILPFGSVASAASSHTACTNGDGDWCDLVILAPESVPADQPFTVKVEVMTYVGGDVGSTLVRGDVCATKVPVSLYVNESYVGTSNASGGIATFTISLPASDYPHNLNASANWNETSACWGYYSFFDAWAYVMAVPVDPDQPIYPCPPGESCKQTTSGGGTAATLFAETGSFTASFQPLGPGQGCANSNGPADDNGVLNFLYSPESYEPASQKTIVFALEPSLVNKGIGLYKVCWSTDPAGAADTWYYLPDCSKATEGPPAQACVLFRTSTQYNGAFIGISVPPDDPLVYVE